MPNTSERYVGGTYTFDGTIYANEGDELSGGDGPMNITGATVTLRLYRPDGVTLSASGTVTSGAGGTVSYTCATSDLSMPGALAAVLLVVLGGLSLPQPPVPFVVKAAP